MPDFNAELLQLHGVGFDALAVLRQEDDMRAFLDQQPHQVHQPQRTGVVIRARRLRIDDQDLLLFAMQKRRRGHGIRGQLLRQCFAAMRGEDAAVANLIRLHPGIRVGAGGAALGVDHARGRLVEHALAGGAHREGEVGIFVVGRRVAGVETTELREQRARDRQRRAADVVAVAQIAEARILGRFEPAVVPAAAIGEHHAAGFLQAAVGIQQLRADQTGVRVFGESAEQRVEPARLRDGVVVQEDQVFAARQRCAVVAGGDEAAVLRAAVIAHAADLRQRGRRFVATAVVDHDHLERRRGRMRGQCAQAGEGVRELIEDRDDDARGRCF